MLTDLRHALRHLIKAPGFTLVAVLTLALGIGASTTMFSLVNQIVLQPLPYPDAGRLVQLWEHSHGNFEGRNTVAGGVVNGWREQSTTLEDIAAINALDANLADPGRPVRLRGLQVSSNYLRVLRLSPAQGRDFLATEGQAGQDNVVLVTDAAWRNTFAAAPDLLGRSIMLGNVPRTVIGILPPSARLAAEVDFLLPFACGTPGWSRAFAGHNLRVIARMRPAVTIEQVQKEMAAITARQRDNYPAFKKDWGVLVFPLHEEETGPVRPQLILLFGATGCVLLIGCANVAGLLQARAVTRRKEMAVRLALGATRWAVTRQLLTEHLVLALGGGLFGALLSVWAIAAFARWRPADFAPGLPVVVDGSTLGFAVVVSILSGLLAGFAPTWRLARTPIDELKAGGRTSAAGLHRRVRSALIVGQVALSLILLGGAGLLLRSLVRLQSVPLGFDPSGLVLADLTIDPAIAGDATKRVQFIDEIIRRVAALPGVENVGLAPFLPLQGGYTETVRPEGAPRPEALTVINFVSGDYFGALRIPLRAGRGFSAADNRTEAPLTTVIDRDLATRLFGAADPIGRRVQLLGKVYEVVGVTGDVLVAGVTRGPVPLLFLPEVRSSKTADSLAIRTALPATVIAKSVQDAVLALAPNQPIANVRTYDQVLARLAFARHLLLGLLSLFAIVAVGLAALGLYGILAFSVEQRTHELGIRSALGASSRDLFLLVIAGGLKLTAAGLALGLLGSLLLSRLLAGFLFGISATDPLTLAGVSLLLLAVASLAAWLPARRATRVDPLDALRAE